MFTTGRIIFTVAFAVVFIIAMILSYKKDKTVNSVHYPNVSKIVLGILLILLLLYLIVKARKLLF